jgi:type I site-specific deoxyribonuclease, hsdR family
MGGYTETDYEHSLIELFTKTLGYEHVYGPDIERDFHSPLFHTVLEDSLYRINADLPQEAIREALSKLQHFENAELLQKNKLFMDYLQNGIEVQYFGQGQAAIDHCIPCRL